MPLSLLASNGMPILAGAAAGSALISATVALRTSYPVLVFFMQQYWASYYAQNKPIRQAWQFWLALAVRYVPEFEDALDPVLDVVANGFLVLDVDRHGFFVKGHKGQMRQLMYQARDVALLEPDDSR